MGLLNHNTHMLLKSLIGQIAHKHTNVVLLNQDIDLIKQHCGDFLNESNQLPVFKSLSQHKIFVKIKARTRKKSNRFSQVFNEAFDQHTHLLRQRAIFAHGCKQSDGSTYYMFPPNGFKLLFNPQVVNSDVYEQMYHQTNDDTLISQLLTENYQDGDLMDAIQSKSEILFFNTPYCYAVNVNSVESYNDLLSLLSIK